MADPQQAVVFRSKVRAGDLVAVRKMLQAGVDFTQPGKTLREWTPLHTAAWGTAKPQNDRDIVEALLTAAHKSGKGKEEALRSAKDAKDGSAQHAQDAGARVPWHGWLSRGGPRRSGGGRPCRSGGGGRACGTRTSPRPLNRQARRRWTWRGSVARRWVRALQRRARRAEKSKRRVARGGPGRHACARVAPRSSPPSSLGPALVARRSRPHLGPQPPTRLRFFSLLPALLFTFAPAQAKGRQDHRVASERRDGRLAAQPRSSVAHERKQRVDYRAEKERASAAPGGAEGL